MYPAIFLDRDGVIIENRPNYVRTWADVEIYPQALEALVKLSKSDYKLVMVTNQSGIGRGLIPFEVADEINQKLLTKIHVSGGRIDGVFMCPHAPADNCDCRKPAPGLLLQAADALSLDLSHSYMIGDALTDLQAGLAAGVKQVVLVRTGRGADQEALPAAAEFDPFPAYTDLSAAIADLLEI
jgi:D-glycero-D-manno-heptose 1,7-bisphosphate phosphatase